MYADKDPETDLTGAVSRAVRAYLAARDFNPQEHTPPNTAQRSGDPCAKPFDLIMTLPEARVLMLELKVVRWPKGIVKFQPHQHEWLKTLWRLNVPIYVGYSTAGTVSYKSDDRWQSGNDDTLLQTGRVAAPDALLDVNHQYVRSSSHQSLRGHLDKLMRSDAESGIERLFVLLHKDIREFFRRLSGALLVVLFNPSTRDFSLLSAQEFEKVLATLSGLVESSVESAELIPEGVESLVSSIQQALIQKTKEIRVAVARMKMDEQLGFDSTLEPPSVKIDQGPSPKPKPGDSYGRRGP